MFYLFLLTIFTSSFYCTVITTEESNITYTHVYNTTSGLVRGTILDINGTQVDQLLGIPFAISPLNYSRFGTPKPMTKWPDLYNATSPARACMQAHSERGFENKYYNMSKNDQSEDCLQLNMWIPNPINATKKGVLVFIFGGGFRFGSPSLDIYNGSVLAAKTDLIVVNINYRLGMLGFAYMSKGDNVTGNMGLLDQQMALKWIHENIANFSGDPNNVTLWGQGSGAICASAHLFSKNSENYFQKLILMSGSINSLLAAKEPSYVDSATRIAAQNMGCFNTSTPSHHEEIFNCLVNQSAENIMKSSEYSSSEVDMPTILGENIILNDTYFFNGSLYFKLLTGKIKSYVDILFGMPNKDGSFYLPILKDSKKYGCNYTEIFEYDNNTCSFNYSTYYNFYNLTRVTLRINDTVFKDVVQKWYYVSNETKSMRDNATKFLTDVTGRCHLVDFAKKVSSESHGTFYSYIFETSSSRNNWPQWMVSTHDDEIDYAFGMPFRYPEEYNKNNTLEEEKALSEKIMGMIKRFTEKKGFYPLWDKFTETYRRGVTINKTFDPEKPLPTVDDIESYECKEFLPFLPKYLMYHGDLQAKILHPEFNDTDFEESFKIESAKYLNNSDYYYSENETALSISAIV